MARVRKDIALDREREAWKLRLQGWTQENIAARLGCDQTTISLCLKRIERKLHTEFIAQAEETKALQHAQLEEVYREAMEKWHRSCEPRERVTVQTGRVKVSEMGGTTYLPDLETRTTEPGLANPALLTAALKAKADQRAIWGLDAPQKQEIAGPGGGPIAISEVVVEKSTRGADG